MKTRLKRYASVLTTLAVIGQFANVILFFLMLFMFGTDEGKGISPSPALSKTLVMLRTYGTGHFASWLAACIAPAFAAQAWLLARLYSFGAALMQVDPLSPSTATALSRLGNSILIYVACGTFGMLPALALLTGRAWSTSAYLQVELNTLYLSLVSFLVIRACALMLRQGAEARDENRSFV